MKGAGPQIVYAPYERAIMRGLFALVVAFHMPGRLPADRMPAPNGLAQLLDLRLLLNPQVFWLSQYLLWAALLLYVLRIGWSFVLPYMTLLSVAVGSIQNSHGAIGHHLQIVSLVLMAQTAGHFYDRFVARSEKDATGRAQSESRLIFWSQQAIAATYLASGLTKLINTGGRWFFQSPLAALQIIKTTDQDYYNTLDRASYGAGVALAEWMLLHPFVVAIIFGMGLVAELTSPLLLIGRRWALVYGCALLVFHESILRVMKLGFPYNEYLLWIYLVNLPFWVLFCMRRFGASKRRVAADAC